MHVNLVDFKRAIEADYETVIRFLSDIPPTAEPVDVYITDVDERCALFGELQQLAEEVDAGTPYAATLGFFMIAPVERIPEHLASARRPLPLNHLTQQELNYVNWQAPKAVSTCMVLILLPTCPTRSNVFPKTFRITHQHLYHHRLTTNAMRQQRKWP